MQNSKYLVLIIFALVIFNSSCEIINPEEPIPSYIKIDSYSVATNYIYEGTAKHDLNDVWILHNGKIVSTTPMPCTIPVLKDNSNTITIYPGVKVSATSTNRKIYPFFEGIDVDLNFDNAGSITTLNESDLVFKYKDNLNFLWLEDFESETISIQEVNKNAAPFQRTKNPNNVYEGIGALQVDISEKDTFMAVQGFNFYNGSEFAPGAPVFLEMHYKNDITMQVGFAYKSANGIVQYDQPHLYLRSTDQWRKVYVNMSDAVNLLADDAGIKVYFAALLPTDTTQATILIDNLKLITFE